MITFSHICIICIVAVDWFPDLLHLCTGCSIREAPSAMRHLRWQACVHWRRAEHAKKASRGAIMAILNPHLIEFDSKWGRDGKETLLLVENPLTIEKLGECPTLGSCKKKGCKLPCNLLQREAYCRRHLDEIYATKSVRVAMGGANAKAAAVLGRKRSISQIEREVKVAKMEAAA